MNSTNFEACLKVYWPNSYVRQTADWRGNCLIGITPAGQIAYIQASGQWFIEYVEYKSLLEAITHLRNLLNWGYFYELFGANGECRCDGTIFYAERGNLKLRYDSASGKIQMLINGKIHLPATIAEVLTLWKC